MSRIAYVNGRYVAHAAAWVHVEDRGFQFADGVYEVMLVVAGRPVDQEAHLDRLDTSLAALAIPAPMARAGLRLVLRQVLRRNGLTNASLYIQVTRGVARRQHAVPPDLRPSLVVTVKRLAPQSAALIEHGVAVATVPDLRWKRRDVKSVALLPNVLAIQAARGAGAHEAWQVEDDGTISEGASSNAYIITADGEVVTRPADWHILAGITRATVLAEAAALGLAVRERPFTVAEAQAAAEAFLTSTTQRVVPVVRIDGQPVGDGRPGRQTRALRAAVERALWEQVNP